jgi:hypothetical protein
MRDPHLFACDKRFAMPFATTLSPIADADKSGERLEFHVPSDGVSDRIRRDVG